MWVQAAITWFKYSKMAIICATLLMGEKLLTSWNRPRKPKAPKWASQKASGDYPWVLRPLFAPPKKDTVTSECQALPGTYLPMDTFEVRLTPEATPLSQAKPISKGV